MGLEAVCRARFGAEASEGKAHLDGQELQFKGGFRLRIPLKDARAEAKAGTLRVRWPEGELLLELGAAAEAWALRIRYPRSLADKLGIKPGSRVVVLGVKDPGLRGEIEARTEDVSWGRVRQQADLVLVGMTAKDDLPRLLALEKAIRDGGAVWVVWPKGQKAFREDDVRAFAPRAGLVDVKVVSVSETLSGLKLMRRRAK
jgi:hypothetical protein